MQKSIVAILLCSFFLSFSTQCADAQKKKSFSSKPDFGVVFNEDGDFAFVDTNAVLAERLLRANVDGHAALGINTYVFSIGAGSDVLYYNSKIASSYGWRKTKYDESESWKHRIECARKAIANGLDAVQIAGDEAKKNKMLFIPSMRMNDSHFIADPYNYPLTGKFWLDNAKDLLIKESPVAFNKDYGNLFDFSNKAVREFRLAEFEEAVNLHKKYIDGFELDFNRVQIFFPKGKAAAGKVLMTELVKKVRGRLNELSKELGRPMYLFVRIPPSDEACEWAGLDVYNWIKQGLVDIVSPAQLMTLAHDMPIQKLINYAKKYNTQVYPSLYPRTSYRVPLLLTDTAFGMDKKIGRIATLAETIGAAENYRSIGADGFYLFNYKGGDADEGFRPHPDFMYVLVAALKYNKPDAGEKVFAITKTYYNDNLTPSYAYVKQLPKKVFDSTQFTIVVGTLPEESPFPLLSCVLRIGIKPSVVALPVVILNGKNLALLQNSNQLQSNSGKALAADMADASLLFAISDVTILKRGENKININGLDAVVTDVEIGYAYYNQLNSFMLGKQPPALNNLKK